MSRHRHPDNSRARPTWLPTPTRTGLGVGALAAVCTSCEGRGAICPNLAHHDRLESA